jgi:hypothetical protein
MFDPMLAGDLHLADVERGFSEFHKGWIYWTRSVACPGPELRRRGLP